MKKKKTKIIKESKPFKYKEEIINEFEKKGDKLINGWDMEIEREKEITITLLI